MATAIPITVRGGNLPLNFEPTARDYSIAFFRRLQITVDGNRLLLGSMESGEPEYNVGPWLSGTKWMAWDDTYAKYIPAGINFSTNGNVMGLSHGLTANRTLTLPDKAGSAALLSDVYVPRETILLSGITPNIDWSLSNTFMLRLVGNTTITFSNISEAQKIIVVLINAGTNYTVTWPATARWPGGAAPVQPVAIAGQNAAGLYILRESDVTGASRVYGNSLSANAPSLSVNTGGPANVPEGYGEGNSRTTPTKNLP